MKNREKYKDELDKVSTPKMPCNFSDDNDVPAVYPLEVRDCDEDTLGTRIKTMRKEQGLSQSEVCEKAGHDKYGLSKHENSKQAVSWYIFLDYAEAMGYTIDMIVRKKEK